MKSEKDYIYFTHQNNKNNLLTSLTLKNKEYESESKKNNKYMITFNTIKSKKLEKLPEIKLKFKNSVKLPLLIDNNIDSSFEKRKNYKINIPKKKINLVKLIRNNNENKNKNENIKENKNNKKDQKNKLYNYFLKKSERRRKKWNELLYEINKTEDRYNKEIPDLDSDLTSKDKNLVENKWKNSFYLDEYQQFFMRNLKGKISSMNYRQMTQKFREITSMCFRPGNEHFIPKKLELIDYI